MFLGTDFEVPWEETRLSLNPGDRILLMSDGYLEQAGVEGEVMLDDDRCAAYFLEAAGERSPEAVIDQLFRRLDAWRGETVQGDDVTLVVIQVLG